MNHPLLVSVRSWLAGIFFSGPVDRAADATRWGWLPALSGIAVAGDHARSAHALEAPETPGR